MIALGLLTRLEANHRWKQQARAESSPAVGDGADASAGEVIGSGTWAKGFLGVQRP
jgi:hypothetical protein